MKKSVKAKKKEMETSTDKYIKYFVVKKFLKIIKEREIEWDKEVENKGNGWFQKYRERENLGK